MPYLFHGQYPFRLDDQSGFILPAPVSKFLGGETLLTVICGLNPKIWLYPGKDYQSHHRIPDEGPQFGFTMVDTTDMDADGRVHIPEHVVHLARLQRDLTLLGVRDHLEIWNRVDWDEEARKLIEG